MEHISLTDSELDSIKSLLNESMSTYSSVDETQFLIDAPVVAHEFPRRVRAFMNHFKHAEPSGGACIVSTERLHRSRRAAHQGR